MDDRFGRIELKVHTLSQLFNSMDPSPFIDKDLDQEAEDYIRGWAAEYPPELPLKLVVRTAEVQPGDREQVEAAMRNFFQYRADGTRREFGRQMARGRLSLAIGLSILVAGNLAGELVGSLGSGPSFRVLQEGLVIGGWVAMWRPMETFLYDWWPLRRQWRDFERLARLKVEVLTPS